MTAAAEDGSQGLFERLIAFEDRPDLLDFRFPYQGILLWPFTRWNLLLHAMGKVLGWEQGHAESEPLSLSEKARYVLTAFRHRPGRALRHFDVLFFGSAMGVAVKRDGKWFGRVNDHLVCAHSVGTLLIEDSYRRRFKLPRYVPNLRFHDHVRLKAAALAKAGRGPSASEVTRIGDWIRYLRGHFPVTVDEAFYGNLESFLLRLSTRLPHLHSAYATLFERVRPKLLLMEDGSYGTQSYLLKWAREMGIRTAEFQHGCINHVHHAYNYGAAGFRPEYAPYLPEYLLTHGNFWSGNAKTPSKKVVVGNPYFTERVAEYQPLPATGGRTLLIISQGDVTSHMVELARDLSRLAPEIQILFRLHPGEVPFTERFRELQGIPNITIDSKGDLYTMLASCDWLVGASSTVLYEAIGFGKPVYVMDNSSSRFYTPPGFGVWIKSAEDLLSAIRKDGDIPGLSTESVWAIGWEDNYRRFLREEIGIGPAVPMPKA